MTTITIRTKDSVESMPVRDETRVKDIAEYIFNNYKSQGIEYKLNLHNEKGLN